MQYNSLTGIIYFNKQGNFSEHTLCLLCAQMEWSFQETSVGSGPDS